MSVPCRHLRPDGRVGGSEWRPSRRGGGQLSLHHSRAGYHDVGALPCRLRRVLRARLHALRRDRALEGIVRHQPLCTSTDLNNWCPYAKVYLNTLKKYGMVVADGTTPGDNWDNT